MSDTMQDVRLDEKVTTTDDGDHDRFQHYFLKKEIDANLWDGTPMTALCGKVVAQQVDPQGRTVCGTCLDVYENVVGTNTGGTK